MKKYKTLLFTLLSLCALSLSGCSGFLSLFNRSVTVTDLPTTQLKNTYNDYMNNNFYKLDSTPLVGQPKLLVVPVWFTNSSTYIPVERKAEVRQDIEKAYFGKSSEVGWRSVATYYQELSNLSLNLKGVVTDWYECDKPSSYFYSEEQGAKNTVTLVQDVVEYYREHLTPFGYDLNSFDTDGNGYLDGVVLIYGSPDYGALKNNNASNMWAYCFWTQQDRGTEEHPVANAFFWASYDFLYGYNTRIGSYSSGDTSNCKLDTHTYIHEMGHMLGLEDYYDYSGQYVPAGGFSMQDYNVGSHDPYSVMSFGWTSPMIPAKTMSLKLRPFQSSHDVILLSSRPSQVLSPFDEYLLLEYYTPTGLNNFDVNYSYMNKYPTGSKTSGIRLWHVDARLLRIDSRSEDARVSFATSINKGYFYTHAFSNTYYSDETKDYVTPLYDSDPKYANYNILQLIRNNTHATFEEITTLSKNDLFLAGDTFKMNTFKKQFVNEGKMNDTHYLGWSFKVNKITDGEAIVTVTFS